MAYIKNIRIRKTLSKALDYIISLDKTCIVSGDKTALNYVSRDSATSNKQLISTNGIALEDIPTIWEMTRKKYKKDDKVLAHHFVQSFDPIHHVTPEEAHKIGLELAEKQFGKLGFDYVVSTHVDKLIYDEHRNDVSGQIYNPNMKYYDINGNQLSVKELKITNGRVGGHMHNHILVNNVARTGKNKGYKYYHNDKSYRRLRELNIDTCRDHGIPAVDCTRLDKEYKELHPDIVDDNPKIDVNDYFKSVKYIHTRSYDSWTEKENSRLYKIRAAIDEQIKFSSSWEEFVSNMEILGYKVDWQTKDGSPKKYVTYTPPGSERGRRDRVKGMENYTREKIIQRIEQRDKENSQSNSVIVIQHKTTYRIKPQYAKYKFGLNPKYKKVYRGLKTYWVKRGPFEQWIIENLYKKKAEVKRRNAYLIKKPKEVLEKEKRDVEKLRMALNYIHSNQIKRYEDIPRFHLQLTNQIEEKESQMASLKEELKQIDIVLDHINYINRNYNIIDEYSTINDDSQKESFYRKYKTHIQKYEYSKRFLESSGISLNQEEEYKNKQTEYHSRIDDIAKEINNIEIKRESLNVVKNILNTIENNSKQHKIKIKRKDRTR